MRDVQADPAARGPLVSAEAGVPTAPHPPASRPLAGSGAVGVLLDGRYRLLQRRTKDGPAATWDGEDDQLQRPVVLHVVAGATAAEAVDAARRSAAVEDDRLPHLLDVGLDRAADGTALGWVVTERSSGRPLADLLREAPLPAARARALVGEAAAVLARASTAGLHHRRLEPSSVLLTADGAVAVLGLEVAAAAAGLPAASPADADREDAVGLTRLLYAALTGLWPAGRQGSLGAAPLGRGGAPVAPGDLAPGVPSDLDTLCAAVLGPYDEGPRSPAEVAAHLAPWGSATGPVTRTGLGIPATPVPAPHAPTGAPADGWGSAAARARLGGGPGLHFAGSPAPTDEPHGGTSAAALTTPAAPAATAAPDERGTRVLHRPPAAPDPAPEHATRAARRAAQRRAEREAAGSADAFDALLGPVTGPRAAVPAAEQAPAAAAPVVRPPRSRPRPAADPAGGSAFDDTDATDWVGAGWGAAPAGAAPVRRTAPRPARREEHPDPRTAAARRAPGATAAPREVPRRSRRTAAVVLGVVALALVVLLVLALTHLADLRGLLGISTASAPATTAGQVAGDGGAAPAGGAASSAPPSAAASSDPGEITSAAAVDPFGDGTENDGGAARAVDGDPATAWSSSTYTTAALGGLKRGVGLSLQLGDGSTPSSVSALVLTTQGTGGTVEVRTSPDGGYDGSTVVATTAAGTGGRAQEVALDEPVTATHLLLWFTALPQTSGGYSATVDEVSAR